MEDLIANISTVIWGAPLIVLLLGAGIFLTITLRGIQFRELGSSLHLALIQRKDPDAENEGDVSHFQALMTALAATIGTGNIVGVATAIAAGGPGALFWMWITALFGMATKYSEALLGVKYRVRDSQGEMSGGPMYYLKNGIGGSTGAILGGLFAVFAAIAAFGIGNMVQANATASAMETAFNIPVEVTGAVLVVLVGAVILGGIRRIGKFTATFVPIMAVLYMIGATIVLVINVAEIPAAIGLVISDAFTGSAVVGGGIFAAIRFGVARGIFSNESGLGTGGIAAAAAQTTQPVRQAMVSMTQTFIDTLVVCSFTGLAIITSGMWLQGFDGSELTQAAFTEGLGGTWGPIVVAVSLAIFSFSTMIGWSYYGERNMEYLFGRRLVFPYRILFTGVIFLGAIGSLQFVWTLADLLNGLMAFPNLIGLLILSGVIARETRDYFRGSKRVA